VVISFNLQAIDGDGLHTHCTPQSPLIISHQALHASVSFLPNCPKTDEPFKRNAAVKKKEKKKKKNSQSTNQSTGNSVTEPSKGKSRANR